MATIQVTRERIAAIMDAVPGLTGCQIPTFERGEVIPPSLIPGYIVYWPGLAEHRYGSASEIISDRRWMVEIVVQEFADDSPLSKQAAYEACETWLDTLAVYFARHRHLAIAGDTGLSGVSHITFRDGGVGEYSRGGKLYASISYPIHVITTTDF